MRTSGPSGVARQLRPKTGDGLEGSFLFLQDRTVLSIKCSLLGELLGALQTVLGALRHSSLGPLGKSICALPNGSAPVLDVCDPPELKSGLLVPLTVERRW